MLMDNGWLMVVAYLWWSYKIQRKEDEKDEKFKVICIPFVIPLTWFGQKNLFYTAN
jgi:hypothetical protein